MSVRLLPGVCVPFITQISLSVAAVVRAVCKVQAFVHEEQLPLPWAAGAA
ncbi:MAG: hypothetical protein ABFD51_00640 [Anaerolineaceae bacterium]